LFNVTITADLNDGVDQMKGQGKAMIGPLFSKLEKRGKPWRAKFK
jgi:hypothetical protein